MTQKPKLKPTRLTDAAAIQKVAKEVAAPPKDTDRIVNPYLQEAKLTAFIPKDLRRRLKAAAAAKEITMVEIVVEGICKELKLDPKKYRIKKG